MAVSLTSNTFNTTYKDDFLDSDNLIIKYVLMGVIQIDLIVV